MEKLLIDEVDLKGKKVLMRVDFNVPMDDEGKITDDTRIRAALPSIKYVLEQGGSLILMSHLGRPDGKEEKYSLRPCAERLSELIERKVKLAPDCIGSEVEEMAGNLQEGDVLLLENLRFHKSETKPASDPGFAKSLSSLADVFVNDAFGTAHRKHSSTYEVAKYFPDAAAAGYLMKKEVDFLGKILSDPDKPFYAIIGGAKVSSKIGVLSSLLEKIDGLFICGAMANTFLKGRGIEIGDSMYEDEYLDKAFEIMEECRKREIKLILPVDLLAVKEIKEGLAPVSFDLTEGGVSIGYKAVDIGPKTVQLYRDHLSNAKTVFWNGPAGIFEIPEFSQGTQAIAEILASLWARTLIGGGDSVSAVASMGLSEKMSHLSTGGGASLEFIESGTLPGIEVLTDKVKQNI
jgi:phosphoglycerate kinase